MNLEMDFLGMEVVFQKFVHKFGRRSLKSLSFENIYCSMGRFIELLTFCPKLEELKIVNCPSLFSVGIEIINWSKFMSHFHERIAQLKRKSKRFKISAIIDKF